MDSSPENASAAELPPIVKIILPYLERQYRLQHMTLQTYQDKLRRLRREELGPRGFLLSERLLPNGGTQFLIKETKSGRIAETLTCGDGSVS